SGVKPEQETFWEQVLNQLEVIPFDSKIVLVATAVENNIPLATLNRKHFERIESLKLADL
ncbi:MAG TPA: hypothetical protein VHW43_11145, partial [Puia sp.]|nr:hypothetical protein [Puia sp.]